MLEPFSRKEREYAYADAVLTAAGDAGTGQGDGSREDQKTHERFQWDIANSGARVVHIAEFPPLAHLSKSTFRFRDYSLAAQIEGFLSFEVHLPQ